MRIKEGLIAALWGLICTTLVQAQTYDGLWKQMREAQEKSLPATVLQLATDIYRKAETEKNAPQMLKVYVWRMEWRMTVDPDSFQIDLKGLETWAKQAESPTDKAVIHSLIAERYADYVTVDRRSSHQSTVINDSTPAADLREWPVERLLDQAVTHIHASLKDSTLLAQTSTRSYLPFVILRDASDVYQHDLYHLLAKRAVACLSQLNGVSKARPLALHIEQIYKQMTRIYLQNGNKEAYLWAVLDYLEWQKQANEMFKPFRAPQKRIGLTQDPYIAGLNKLMAEYQDVETCAEVYLAKATYARQNNLQTEALRLCNEAIDRYPRYKRINEIRRLKETILHPELSVSMLQTVYPNEKVDLQVRYRNLTSFTLEVYRAKKLVSRQQYLLQKQENYQPGDTVLTLKTPSLGQYTVRILPNIRAKKNDDRPLYVSRIKTLSLKQHQEGKHELITLDSKTGHPIPNVHLQLFDIDNRLLQELTTNADGKAMISSSSNIYSLKADKGEDNARPMLRIHLYHAERRKRERNTGRTMLLTDRALYRPGQTVHVKGIAYQSGADSTRVLADKGYMLTLIDAQGQTMEEQKVRTNAFGSFVARFVLPDACLNGTFYVQTEGQRVDLRVEDFKRPTFDLTFDRQADSYRLGEEIQVKGLVQTFSGVPLQHLPLKYVVRRTVFRWWRMGETEQMASGETVISADGRFSIPVLLAERAEDRDLESCVYHYSVEVSATDVSGETQTSTQLIAAGKRSLLLSAEGLETMICKDRPFEITLAAYNLSQQPVNVPGTYRLYRISHREDTVLVGTPVQSGTFTTNRPATMDWKQLPSGYYRLAISAEDSQGRPVAHHANTLLFSETEVRPAVHTAKWVYAVNEEFDADHPALFYYGTSLKEVYLMMSVSDQERIIESRVFKNLSDSILRFEYPYQERYGDGITVNFCFVKNNTVYRESFQLHKRLPEKKLTMKWNVFRDHLRPGQQEEWKLSIRTPDDRPARAELLALMYDASLDKIWKKSPDFSIYTYRNLLSYSWDNGSFDMNHLFFEWDRVSWGQLYREYDCFTRPVILPNHQTRAPIILKAAFMSSGSDVGKNMLIGKAESADRTIERMDAQENDEAVLLSEAPAYLRTNFSETAFFYPQLHTDASGEISFSFTLPQSLTRWNFRGYAHTQQMQLGTLTAEITTSKEFMLTSHLPRFVRVADQTAVAASIANLTERMQEGVVSLELFDPMTNRVVNTQKQRFSVEAGQSVGVDFRFTVGEEYSLLGCRMTADGGAFSDGEQRLIPVLSNKESLVETVALPIRGQQTKEFSLDRLFNRRHKSATNRRLTVEFTANPAWYAVQALPSLAQPTSNDAIAWASVYYANALASHVLNSQPRIRAVFDRWKQSGDSKETFMSQLQKNPEMKNILLSESPWLMEAQTEEQQRARIGTLFDLNHIRNNNRTALAKLKELQHSSGGWSWYKGMPGSRYVTTFIAEVNARLALLTGVPLEGAALEIQQSAFTYLHNQALKEYQVLRKEEEKGREVKGLSKQALQYLYLVAISGEKVPEPGRQAHRYFLSKASTLLTSSSMEEKALAAVVLEKSGRRHEALPFIASLKQHLTRSDELGMYFAFNARPYTPEGLQISAHVAVMEALASDPESAPVVEEMKLWLLKQKQTQQWNSPVTTVNAVFALLMQSADLENRGDVRITLGKEVIETASLSEPNVPGLGYVKRTFTQKETIDARKVIVEKSDPGVAWGAVYAQYELPVGDIEQQGGELNVKKQLYVERVSGTTTEWQPVTKQTPLRVGDKVMARLILRLDRRMDFVQLKDQRGACFEPLESLSGYRWTGGLGYYTDVKDASTRFFFESLEKGVYVLEHRYRVARAGTYESGIATFQSAYAPEFVSHSASLKVSVE